MSKYIRILVLIIGICLVPIEGYSYIYQNISEVEIQRSACCKKSSEKEKCHNDKHSCANSFSCSQTIILHLHSAVHKPYKKNEVVGIRLPIDYKELSLLSVYLSKWVPPKIS